jgi:signal transduction histidine kinase
MAVHQQLLRKATGEKADSRRTVLPRAEEPKPDLQARIADLELARKSAEASNQAKSLFLANIIHEIRTPMNAILGYAQLLRRAPDIPKTYRNAIETIERSGGHLLALINDVLDLSKIEAGCMELQLSDFDLNALLYDMSAMFDMRDSQKKLHWRVEIWHPPEDPLLHTSNAAVGLSENSPGTPTLWSDSPIQMQGWRLLVHGDERKLRQVLINLLSNAVKFTDHGEVVLKVVLPHQQSRLDHEKGQPNINQFYFEVRDTGPGIAAEAQTSIFEAFHQGTDGTEKGGTGLGLAIATRLIELMGGELHLESKLGAGSRFFFAIPLSRAQGPEPPDFSRPSPVTPSATINFAELKTPATLYERLKTTAELYSTTEFKLCLRELEKLGEPERLLVARFRELLQSYDMESILTVLSAVKPAR